MVRHIGIILWSGFAVAFVFVASASTALALPDLSIALGGSYPIHLEGNLPTAAWSLGSASGVLFSGTGVSILTLTNELSALGAFSLTFLAVKQGAKSCNTPGDAKGVLLLSGAFHIVLGPGGTASLLFILFLFNPIVLFCEGLEIELRGSLLGTFSLASGSEVDEYTTALVLLEGEKGKQKFTQFTNDAGETVTAQLLSESGSGFVESDLNIAGDPVLSVLEGKMFTVTGR